MRSGSGDPVLVGEDRDQATVARVEVEVTLGRVVEVGLVEHEGHAEQALPEVDRGLPVGPHDRDVVDTLALELAHRAQSAVTEAAALGHASSGEVAAGRCAARRRCGEVPRRRRVAVAGAVDDEEPRGVASAGADDASLSRGGSMVSRRPRPSAWARMSAVLARSAPPAIVSSAFTRSSWDASSAAVRPPNECPATPIALRSIRRAWRGRWSRRKRRSSTRSGPWAVRRVSAVRVGRARARRSRGSARCAQSVAQLAGEPLWPCENRISGAAARPAGYQTSGRSAAGRGRRRCAARARRGAADGVGPERRGRGLRRRRGSGGR